MKNKYHEYILRAAIEAPIPTIIKNYYPALIAVDSVIGGYSSRILGGECFLTPICTPIIDKTTKENISKIINQSIGEAKSELVIYYRLMVLAEEVIMRYVDTK